jgi:hypothetical protein
MSTQTNPFANRTKHALGGGAWGVGIALLAALAIALLGGIHSPTEVGVMLGLSLFAGLVIGWLAG